MFSLVVHLSYVNVTILGNAEKYTYMGISECWFLLQWALLISTCNIYTALKIYLQIYDDFRLVSDIINRFRESHTLIFI